MVIRISALLVSVVALLTPIQATAQETRPRSVLVLDQADMRGPFYYQVFSGFRSVVNADSQSRITLYTESLDLSGTCDGAWTSNSCIRRRCLGRFGYLQKLEGGHPPRRWRIERDRPGR